MKKSNIRGFVFGVIFTLLVTTLVSPALAKSTKVQKSIEYKNIGVTLDGQKIDLKDAAGNSTEPFMMDGSNYLPVRALAEVLGLNVSWDSNSSTVVLKSSSPSSGSTSGATKSGTVIMDSNGIKVTYLGIAKNTGLMGGYNINLRIQNASSTNYTVQDNSLSVNGIMATSEIFSTEVAAGKTANTAILVYDLAKDGISEPITTAEFKLHVFITDTFEGDFDSNVITVNK